MYIEKNPTRKEIERSISYLKLKLEKSEYRNYPQRIHNGSDCNSLVQAISEHEELTEKEKIKYLRDIQQRNGGWASPYELRRSSLNFTFVREMETKGFVLADKLGDIDCLQRYGLVYTKYMEVPYVVTTPAIEGFTTRPVSIEKTKNCKVVILTPYGQDNLNTIAEKGMRYARKDLANLQKIGLI